MERQEAKEIIENILFVADSPIGVPRLAEVFNKEFTEVEVVELLEELRENFESRALQVSEVAEGWRLQTRQEFGTWITTFFKMERGQKLSRASLEVLAIVSYRQPITRAEIDDIRGVDSGGVLRGLIDKTLVRTMGRRKVPGRPMMYGTTNRFLEYFGLSRLADMPTLDEYQNEFGEGLSELARQETIAFAGAHTDEESTGIEDAESHDEPDADHIEPNGEHEESEHDELDGDSVEPYYREEVLQDDSDDSEHGELNSEHDESSPMDEYEPHEDDGDDYIDDEEPESSLSDLNDTSLEDQDASEGDGDDFIDDVDTVTTGGDDEERKAESDLP